MTSTSSLSPEKLAKVLEVALYAFRQPELRDQLIAGMGGQGMAVLRKLESSPLPVGADPEREAAAKIGIYLDTETTGLDHTKDGVTQLALLRFRYDDHGIVSIDDQAWTRFNDPGVPIEAEAGAITGITDEMVKDKFITPAEIREQLAGAQFITAHKANFDRPMAEKSFPDAGFDTIPWFCTLEDIAWAVRGYAGKSLEILSLKDGWVYAAHDAQADVLAGATLLASTRGSETPVINEMLETGSRNLIRIIAANSAFEAKDMLKARGYRWDGESKDTGHKAWWIDITDTPETVAAEREFLRTVYGKSSSAVLPAFRISPLNRFSLRTRAHPEKFPIAAPLELTPVATITAPTAPAAEPALF